jgi:hypothetical protein
MSRAMRRKFKPGGGKPGSLAAKSRPRSAESRAAERATADYREKNGELAKYRDPSSPFYGMPLPVTVETPSDAPRLAPKRF